MALGAPLRIYRASSLTGQRNHAYLGDSSCRRRRVTVHLSGPDRAETVLSLERQAAVLALGNDLFQGAGGAGDRLCLSAALAWVGTGTVYADLVRRLEKQEPLGLSWRLAEGGPRRQDSVYNGLCALPGACDAVLVHDSARPFFSASLTGQVLAEMKKGSPGVVPGIAVADTIKQVDSHGMVLATPVRNGLRAVQTPQGFCLSALRCAHEEARRQGWEATDDASLLERCSVPVAVIAGEEANRKITIPEDLELLRQNGRSHCAGERIMPEKIPCSGLGYDVHRYNGSRPFILGGVPIACSMGVHAHSDGDTLLHALMDALLGCVGEGDIGKLFPDTDPSFANISSGLLLAEVYEHVRRHGLQVTQVDITVIAQVPRIAPHREQIRVNIAKLLELALSQVNVKATTEEGLGFTGEKKGIKVLALVSGLRPAPDRGACPPVQQRDADG